MTLFLKITRLGNCTGISFIDSTPLRVCHNKRIFNHKVFDGIATRDKSTMGIYLASSFISLLMTKEKLLILS